MGRGLLFIVAASLIGVSSVIFMGQKSRIAIDSEQGQYGHQVSARDIAQSGVERAISEVRKDRMAVTKTRDDVSVAGGEYDINIEEHNYGELTLVSSGRSGDAEHTVSTDVVFATPLEGAVVLNAPEVTATTYGNYTISGVDHRVDGSFAATIDDGVSDGDYDDADNDGDYDSNEGEMDYSDINYASAASMGFMKPARGIMVNSETNANVVKANINAARVTGDGGESSVGSTSQKAMYDQMYLEAMGDASVQFLSGPFAGSYGSKNDPAIVSIAGNFEPAGPFSGYGLLIVNDGNFIANEHFNWNGVVMARKSATAEVNVIVRDGAEIRGSLVAYESTPVAIPTCVVPFNIQGLDTVPQEAFKVRFDVVGAAISAGGSYDMPVTTKLHMEDETAEPWGPWNKAIAGNVNRDGLFVHEPDVEYGAGTRVTVSAASWMKAKGTDGSSESDWSTYMKQDSRDNGPQLTVLRDGDTAPSVDGYLDQTSAAEFLADYLNGDGTVNLGDNQTIYLFELGSSNPSSLAFDMQDLVVLVTLTAGTLNPTPGCTATSGGATGRINFEIGNNAAVRYSPEAIAKLGKKLPVIETATRVAVVSQKASTARSGDGYQ